MEVKQVVKDCSDLLRMMIPARSKRFWIKFERHWRTHKSNCRPQKMDSWNALSQYGTLQWSRRFERNSIIWKPQRVMLTETAKEAEFKTMLWSTVNRYRKHCDACIAMIVVRVRG
ncbi:unnamed protein product [Calypogeia fissa]